MLSERDFITLGKWLKSPWCNSNKNLYRYYKILKPYYPDFDSKALTIERISKKIYGNKPYRPQVWYNLMSELLRQIEAFQIHETLRADQSLSEYYHLQVLLKYDQAILFLKKTERFIKRLEEKIDKDLSEFYQLITLYQQQYDITNSMEIPKGAYDMLKQIGSSLDQFYSLGKSRYLLNALEAELKLGVTATKEGKNDFDRQLHYLEKISVNFDNPTLKIYRDYLGHRHLTLEEQFHKLKQEFFKDSSKLPIQDQRTLLLLLINMSAELIRKEDNPHYFFEKAFELYKKGLEDKLLLEYKFMRVTIFGNIVATSNFLKQTEFSKAFIEKYYEYLNPTIRLDVYNWARTHTAFHSGDAAQIALAKKMIQTKSINNRFLLRTKILSIQMWIQDLIQRAETETEFILSNCRALDRQLARSRILPSKNKQTLRKLVYYMMKIISLLEDYTLSQEELLALEKQINLDTNVDGKSWLLQKIEELKKSISL